MAEHETAWAEGLAQEHAHQRELLAAVRGEIGAFAKECAPALSALDACVGGLGAFASALQAGSTAHEHATLVLDAGRRFRQLGAGAKSEEAELYESFAGEGNLPDRAVGHAKRALAADPQRNDRELLQAVVEAAGARAQIENILGPAPVAVLAGLAPLAQRLPLLAKVSQKEAKSASVTLTSVLQSAGSGSDDLGIAAAASLGDSLRDAAAHAQGAAKAVEQGKLRQVVAEAHKQLHEDLDGLRGVVSRAEEASEDWLRDRKGELGELTAEVEAKLERLERIGAWLEQLLPRLQLVGRALSAAEKARTLENQLDPQGQVTAEAARLTLLLGLAGLWGPLLGGRGRAAAARETALPRNRLLIGAAALLLAGAGAGIGVWATSSGGGKAAAPGPTRSITPGPTNFTITATTAPGTTNTLAVIPFRVKIVRGSNSGEFVLSFTSPSHVPIARVDYEAVGSKTSPGQKGCTATSYPAKLLHCPEHGKTHGTLRFYPEQPRTSCPHGMITFTDTSGRTYGPFAVSLGSSALASSG